jgi:hypothetical protein
MRRDRDVMERLAAADPAPHAERLSREEQREAEALLARVLATPIEPAADRRRLRRRPVGRRRLLVAFGAACAAVAAVAAIELFDSGAPGGGGIIEKAVAAVTREDVVYHALERRRATGSGFPDVGQTTYAESWRTTDGRIRAKEFAANGTHVRTLRAEWAGTLRPGRTLGPALRYDPRENAIYPSGVGRPPLDADPVPDIDPFADPGVRLRELQRRGQLRVADTTTFGGRRAYRLVADSPSRWRSFTFEGVEYLVDAETYLPLTQRVTVRVDDPERTYRLFTRYLTYERVPLDSRTRALLDLDPHPGATCATGAGDISGRGLGFPNPCRSDMENRFGAP